MMKQLIIILIVILANGCITPPEKPLTGEYVITDVECVDASLQNKLESICIGKYIYRSRSDVKKWSTYQPNIQGRCTFWHSPFLLMNYKNNELEWLDTLSGFMPKNSDYFLRAKFNVSQERGEIALSYSPLLTDIAPIKFKIKYSNPLLSVNGTPCYSDLLDIGDVIALYYNDNYIFNTYEMTVQTYGKRCDFINGELKYQATKKFQLVISVDLKHKGNRDDTKMLEFYEEWSSEPRDYTHYKLPAPIIVSKWTNNKYSVSYTDTSDGTYQRRFDFDFEISPDVLPK